MNDVEIIDRMLAFDVKENPEGRGYIAPNAMFDAIDAPTDRRAYILQLVIELGMFEYNTPSPWHKGNLYRAGSIQEWRL